MYDTAVSVPVVDENGDQIATVILFDGVTVVGTDDDCFAVEEKIASYDDGLVSVADAMRGK